jgi:hypothetical protein
VATCHEGVGRCVSSRVRPVGAVARYARSGVIACGFRHRVRKDLVADLVQGVRVAALDDVGSHNLVKHQLVAGLCVEREQSDFMLCVR